MISGVSASHAATGWPYFGKQRARSAPERRASGKSAILTDDRLELILFLDAPCDLIGFGPVGVRADLDAVNHGHARRGVDQECGVPFGGQLLDDIAGGAGV